MRFLRRSLTGLFLLSVTLGLLAYAGVQVRDAVQERMAQEPRSFQQRERVFAVNVVPVQFETVIPELTAFGQIESLLLEMGVYKEGQSPTPLPLELTTPYVEIFSEILQPASCFIRARPACASANAGSASIAASKHSIPFARL